MSRNVIAPGLEHKPDCGEKSLGIGTRDGWSRIKPGSFCALVITDGQRGGRQSLWVRLLK